MLTSWFVRESANGAPTMAAGQIIPVTFSEVVNVSSRACANVAVLWPPRHVVAARLGHGVRCCRKTVESSTTLMVSHLSLLSRTTADHTWHQKLIAY